MTFWKWSKTAASNSNADSTINWAEGQAPSSVNDSARAVMAAAAKYRDDRSGALAATGSSNAYAVTTNQGLTSLTEGFSVSFVANHTNTGTATIDVDGLGAKPLRVAGSVEAVSGEILEDAVYTAVYKSASDEWIIHGRPRRAEFPSGTVMLFRQTAAPTGWTKETSNNNAALRIVSGTAGTGGTADFTTAFASRTITQANLPSYNLSTGSITATLSSLSLWSRGGGYGGGGVTTIVDITNQTSGATSAALSASTITIGGSIPSGGSGTAMDFAVKYVDVISATKD
jgi:hypothetical protein